jgi:hypothetical protein
VCRGMGGESLVVCLVDALPDNCLALHECTRVGSLLTVLTILTIRTVSTLPT